MHIPREWQLIGQVILALVFSGLIARFIVRRLRRIRRIRRSVRAIHQQMAEATGIDLMGVLPRSGQRAASSTIFAAQADAATDSSPSPGATATPSPPSPRTAETPCPQCREAVNADHKFCPHCGASLWPPSSSGPRTAHQSMVSQTFRAPGGIYTQPDVLAKTVTD